MTPIDFVKSLIAPIYNGQLTITGTSTLTIKVDDRSTFKPLLYKHLDKIKLPYTDVDVRSSFKGTRLQFESKQITIIYKNFKSTGSGAGAEVTSLGESAQCWYTAVAFNSTISSAEDLSKNVGNIRSKVDTTSSYNDVSTKLTDDWIKSSIVIANYMKSMPIFKAKMTQYRFHRGSSMVDKISKMFLSANRADKRFTDINKWTPADIWVATAAGERSILSASVTQDWVSLNKLIVSLYESKDLIGVSLKKVGTSAKSEVFNYGNNESLTKYTSMKISPKSKDGYLKFQYKTDPNMEIQFRSFDKVSGWQGEIKGKFASGGKIGGGNVAAIVYRIAGVKLSSSDAKQIANKVKANDPSITTSILQFAKRLNVQVDDPNQKDQDWKYSKYLTLEFLSVFSKLSTEKQNKIIKEIVGYASSSTETSVVFIKIS